MSFQHITVFLTNGVTLRFHKVTGYVRDSYQAEFDYESASDGKVNHGVLFLDRVVMVSTAA